MIDKPPYIPIIIFLLMLIGISIGLSYYTAKENYELGYKMGRFVEGWECEKKFDVVHPGWRGCFSCGNVTYFKDNWDAYKVYKAQEDK